MVVCRAEAVDITEAVDNMKSKNFQKNTNIFNKKNIWQKMPKFSKKKPKNCLRDFHGLRGLQDLHVPHGLRDIVNTRAYLASLVSLIVLTRPKTSHRGNVCSHIIHIMLRDLLTQLTSHSKTVTGFRCPRACRIRKYQFENR
jgi:hypothetical protein